MQAHLRMPCVKWATVSIISPSMFKLLDLLRAEGGPETWTQTVDILHDATNANDSNWASANDGDEVKVRD